MQLFLLDYSEKCYSTSKPYYTLYLDLLEKYSIIYQSETNVKNTV